MKKAKFSLRKVYIVVLIFTILLLVGCKRDEITIDSLTESMVLVTYDGNGGYLGNKSSTSRKLYAAIGSIIPNYLTDYTGSQYTTNGLGLAMKDGYQLLGWYIDDDEHVTYKADQTNRGEYVYLTGENGIYKVSSNGTYVNRFEIVENGAFVLLSVEQPADGSDANVRQYVYVDGEFKLFDNENANHIESGQKNGIFNGSSLNPSGYIKYASISDEKLLNLIDNDINPDSGQKEFKKYDSVFKEFDPQIDDTDAVRYEFTSGYAKIEVMMEEDPRGKYVLVGDEYVLFDSTNPIHADLKKYMIGAGYVFKDETKSPSELDRFDVEIKYWTFEKDRITQEMFDKGGIVLKADWHKKLTVHFVYEDFDGVYDKNVTSIIIDYAKDEQGNERRFNTLVTLTTKMNETQTASVTLREGDTLTKPGRVAVYPGYTFVGWSKSPDEYIPWDFDNDTIPEGTSELYIYAYMYIGTYTLIKTADDLSKVATNPSGNYLVMNDIDLGGVTYSGTTPFGFKTTNSAKNKSDVFTGIIKSFSGNVTISNFKISAKNAMGQTLATNQKEFVTGLIPFTFGATISGLTINNCEIVIDASATASQVAGDICVSAIVGRALSLAEAKDASNYSVRGDLTAEKQTIYENCVVNVTFKKANDSPLTKKLTIGDIIAKGKDNCLIKEGCASYYDVSGLDSYETIKCFIE